MGYSDIYQNPVAPSCVVPVYTALVATSTGGAQANNCTLTIPAGRMGYCTGFVITGLGATAAAGVAATLVGQGVTMNFTVAVPAGVGVPLTPLVVTFGQPIQASGTGVNFVLAVPNFGAGNTAASVTLTGFYV